MSPKNSRQYAFALLLFLAATFIFTFPGALKITTHFVGSPRGDKFQFIWNFWWVRHALLDLGQLPFFCPLQYYPTGVSLALHDTTYFWSFLSVPLQSVFDLRTILNLFLLVCFPLNAMAFYHLAREVTGSHRGAVIGGFVFAFCPYLIGRYHVGHIQYLGVFTMPLFLLELYRYNQNPRPRHMACAGIYFCLTALISYYSAAELTLIMAAVFVYRLIAVSKDPGRLKALAAHMSVFLLLAGGVLSIFVAPALFEMLQGDYQLGRASARYTIANSADLVSYLIPDTTLASWRGWELSEAAARWARGVNETLAGNILEKSVFPGWTSLVVLLIALAWRPIRRGYWPWVLLAGSFFILSFGPTLHFKGAVCLEDLMPYRLLSSLPLFGIMRSPSRFTIFVSLGGGLVAAAFCRQLKQILNHRVYNFLTLGLGLFVIFEFLPVAAYYTPNNTFRSPYYRQLRQDPGTYSILNIPIDFADTTGGGDIYVYAQTTHAKPIVGGYVSREPQYALKPFAAYPVLNTLARKPGKPLDILMSGRDWQPDLRQTIAAFGVGRIILHRSLLSPQEQSMLTELFADFLDEPIYVDQWIVVFSTVFKEQ